MVIETIRFLGRVVAGRGRSGQLADSQVLELDGRALGLEAEKAAGRLAVIAAGDFFTVDPEPDLAVDAAHVVMVPLANAFGEMLAGKAPGAVGRETGGNGFIRDEPTGNTSPFVVNQSGFFPVSFSYCSA